MLYVHRKHDGSLPIIGVNAFVADEPRESDANGLELAGAKAVEKQSQFEPLRALQERSRYGAPVARAMLQATATSVGSLFEALVAADRARSFGQITQAQFEVGGQFRRTA